MSTVSRSLTDLAQRVRDLESLADQLGSIRATLLVNFGKDGRGVCGIRIDDAAMTAHQLMFVVLSRLTAAPLHPVLQRLADRWDLEALHTPESGAARAEALRACAVELRQTILEPHADHSAVKLEQALATPLPVASGQGWTGRPERTFEHELLWGHSAGRQLMEFDDCVPQAVRDECARRRENGSYK